MNLVRKLRQLKGLTQHELAALAGTSQSTVAAYETGKKSPGLRTIEKLAMATGMEMDIRFVRKLTREDRRSLAYHEVISVKLLQCPKDSLARARKNLKRLHAMHPHAAPLLNQWSHLLALPPNLLAAFLTDKCELARDLRQVSPFAGMLTANERSCILKRFREETPA